MARNGRTTLRAAGALAIALAVAACGGGGGGGGETLPVIGRSTPPPSQPDAARFMTQASFGADQASLDLLRTSGLRDWIDWQFQMPQTSHLAFVDARRAEAAASGGNGNDQNFIFHSFWRAAISGQDQLRQRVAYALSQIFVISMIDEGVGGDVRGVASYMDMLGRHAFGNFRELLQDVTLHPMMGIYLTHMRNQKEDPVRGRVPDENYAREVLQLFTIGLVQLNQDGTVQVNGQMPPEPIPSYTSADVRGLARVFTGFSWAGPDASNDRFFGGRADPNRSILPMRAYPQFHSTSEKVFLNTTIPAQGTADPEGSLRIALDTLFNHPNVGPFIGRQLIQRLVTSNPSPAYVSRVAAAFNDNGRGVRGDMRAVIRAVLLDPEARGDTPPNALTSGKLREPILRVTAWARAFDAASTSGIFRLTNTENAATSIGQAPMRSPSVFNFYRPGYVPPNTTIASSGLVAPEMQIVHESSVAGYLNTLFSWVQDGMGDGNPRDIQPNYADEVAIANDSTALVDRIDRLLTGAQMSAATKTAIRGAVDSVAIPNNNPTGAQTARLNRVRLAVYLTVTSPDFLVSR